MTDICKLCHKKSKLEQSHIIPKFLFKWLKETSATGYLRFGQNLNKRVQDGFKENLLCRNCENLLNNWETDFANKLFYPLVNRKKSSFKYGSWFSSFVVSLSWRTLICCKRIGLSHCHFTVGQKQESDLALEVWRRYLLGDIKHLGKYQQHVIPIDVVTNRFMPNLPTNINRYFLRSIDIDPIANESQALIYVKIPYFIFLGGIPFDPKQWINTTIQVHGGIIGRNRCTVPQSFGDYIIDKAKRISDIQKNMSDRQKRKVEDAILNDLDRVSRSEMFRAINADVELFGNDVFE